MADAGALDPGRLPWLEPYRAPPARKSNRRPGVAAAIGTIGLAAVVTLLARDVIPLPSSTTAAPQASVVLPAPADLQPPIELAPLAEQQQPTVKQTWVARDPVIHRAKARAQRRIKAVPTDLAYREVVSEQTGEPMPSVALDAATSNAAVAIAALPLPPDPPRPAVNPSAEVVRGKTVQLGVYKSAWQAEAAWRSTIRDYTYLVTMPKSIEPISIRSKRFYRLQLGTPSKKHAKQLCSNLKSIGRACTVA
ncbi:SPOR domain-containing protein [Sphingomonas sp.]|uniref:SPOR domain-containing protein n=1 Tax=Sphingomonas sp. TaxID=28214 RepID=UPI0025FC1B04|nr:SPOR domain-containing protein [Sphingomonas sp.]